MGNKKKRTDKKNENNQENNIRIKTGNTRRDIQKSTALSGPENKPKAPKPKDTRPQGLMARTYPIDNYIQAVLMLLILLLPLAVRLKLDLFISPTLGIPTISTGMHASYFSYYKWVILLTCTVIAAGMFTVKLAVNKYQIKASHINLPLALLAAVILLSTCVADYKMIALVGFYDQHDGALTYLCCLLLLLIAANITFTAKFGRRLVLVLGGVTVVMAVISLLHYMGVDLTQNHTVRNLLAGREYAEYAYGFFSSTLGNQNYTSGFAAALLSFFAALLVWGRKIIHPLYTLIFGLAAVLLLFTSLSSSGVVAAFISLIFIMFLAGYDYGFKRIVAIAVVAIIVLGGSFAYLVKQNPRLAGEVFFWKDSNLSENLESAGTGRGYIWTRTSALISRQPLLGYGANTLAYYYPQYDTREVFANSVATKPHNLYLGVAFYFGLIGLLALLYLFAAHLWQTLKQLIRSRGGEGLRSYQIALICFLLAFWTQGMFNDAVIGSAPLHWILFGLSAALGTDRY